MPERVYLETSIISYLAAHPSRDLVTAARQQITHEWWTRRRVDFEVFISEIVVAEAAAGDADAARRRAQWMEGVPSLRITDEATALGRLLVRAARLPDRAAVDALHISLAACHGMHYLLTWNSTHIANAEFRPKVERACRDNGYEPPVRVRLTNSWGSDKWPKQSTPNPLGKIRLWKRSARPARNCSQHANTI